MRVVKTSVNRLPHAMAEARRPFPSSIPVGRQCVGPWKEANDSFESQLGPPRRWPSCPISLLPHVKTDPLEDSAAV